MVRGGGSRWASFFQEGNWKIGGRHIAPLEGRIHSPPLIPFIQWNESRMNYWPNNRDDSTRILNQHCSRNFERRRQKIIQSTVPIHRKTRRQFQPTINASINEQTRRDLPRMVETKGVQEDDGNQRGSRDKSVLILCHGEKDVISRVSLPAKISNDGFSENGIFRKRLAVLDEDPSRSGGKNQRHHHQVGNRSVAVVGAFVSYFTAA